MSLSDPASLFLSFKLSLKRGLSGARLFSAYVLLIVFVAGVGTAGISSIPQSAADALPAEYEALFNSASVDPSTLDPATLRNAYLLLKLKQYLQSAEQNYKSLEDKIDETRTKIDEHRHEIVDLQGEISHLESLVSDSEAKIKSVEVQMAQKEIDIQKSLERLEFTKIQKEEQADALKAYVVLLYFQKNLYFNANQEANTLKILLEKGTVSDVFQHGTYLSLIEKQTEAVMDRLNEIDRTTKRENYNLILKRDQLETLSAQLEGERRNLTAELAGKENLLRETQGSDEVYRELFASYLAAEEAITQEIAEFKNNIQFLDDRFSSLSAQLSASELELIQSIQSESASEFDIRESANFLQLDWPVSPGAGLTAFFDDSEYVKAFGVAHHAVDVRVPHGTVIFAPADGVVYRVNDTAALQDPKAKLGYGYLIIAHRKGVMTLYGHLSGALVKEGDFIRRGQIIGLTGATPGTPGAGARTTGAHLHLEVLQDGVRVDPLEYLPLADVPMDSLPDKYLRLLEQQLEDALNQEGISSEQLSLEEDIEETMEQGTVVKNFEKSSTVKVEELSF